MLSSKGKNVRKDNQPVPQATPALSYDNHRGANTKVEDEGPF
jgi:hypothetical protein